MAALTVAFAALAIGTAIAMGEVGHVAFDSPASPPAWTQRMLPKLAVFTTMIAASAGASSTYRGPHPWLVSYLLLCATPWILAFLWFGRRAKRSES